MKRLSTEEKAARAADRKAKREEAAKAAKMAAIMNAPHVDHIEINVEWKNSRTWGSNPHLTAWAHYSEPNADGSRVSSRFTATCSGCGYDKLSTVVADCFNHFLRCNLYEIPARKWNKEEKRPYGISYWPETNTRHYAGGVGIECYRAIAEYIGGEFIRVARGESFEAFHFTMGKRAARRLETVGFLKVFTLLKAILLQYVDGRKVKKYLPSFPMAKRRTK